MTFQEFILLVTYFCCHESTNWSTSLLKVVFYSFEDNSKLCTHPFPLKSTLNNLWRSSYVSSVTPNWGDDLNTRAKRDRQRQPSQSQSYPCKSTSFGTKFFQVVSQITERLYPGGHPGVLTRHFHKPQKHKIWRGGRKTGYNVYPNGLKT